MADPLSISASIAGIIGLTNEVAKIVTAYVVGVKYVLEQMLDLLRNEQWENTVFKQTPVLISVLGFTKWQVDDLYKKLDSIRVARESKGLGDKMKDWWERLKWPMKKRRV